MTGIGADGVLLRREIGEQPAVLAETVTRLMEPAREAASAMRARSVDLAVLTGRGSSANAAQYGRYLIEIASALPVSIAAPSLVTMYERVPSWSNAAVIAVSQSGQGTDVVEVARAALGVGALTVAVTNDPTSPLAAEVAWPLVTPAGIERSVPATKTYTSTLVALALLARNLAEDPESHGLGDRQLARLEDAARRVLDGEERIAEAANHLATATRCVVIGRGLNRSTAYEVALKIQETAYLLAQAHGASDFLHGPLAVIEDDFRVVAFVAGGPTAPAVIEALRRARQRGARSLVICDGREAASAARAVADEVVEIRTGLSEALSPIGLTIAGQLLALHTALGRGLSPENPRSLGKVTVTR
jgi:glucosamine--fructose-6-phosphate aminotransferase (isomerizing)